MKELFCVERANAPAMTTELVDDVWQFELRGVNAYLVEDGDDLVLVDAGTPFDAGRIRSGVGAAGYDIGDVDRVLVTHFDLDHVGALARLDGLDATVHAPDPDGGFLTRRASPPLSNHKGLVQRALRVFVRPPSLPVERVTDGDEVGEFTAYRTPGHTPGHTVYASEAQEVAFLGDLVMESDGTLSVPFWLLNYDTDTAAESVRTFADRAPSFDVATMGHGDPIVDGGDEALRALADGLD